MSTLTIFILLILAVFIFWSAVAFYHYRQWPEHGWLSAYDDAFHTFMNIASFGFLIVAVVFLLWLAATFIQQLI